LSAESLRRAPEVVEEWVTLTSFSDAAEAEVMRGLLEQANLQVRLTDANTARMLGVPTMALGGVGLQVPALDVGHARAVIHQAEARPGAMVFRVHNRAVVSTSAISAAGAALVATVLAQWHLLPGRLVSVFIILAALVGLLLGRRRVFYLCSNLRCGARLLPAMTVCPKCGGAVAGTIRSLNQRLEAEEELRKQAPGEPE
jgi:hypothetical protein